MSFERVRGIHKHPIFIILDKGFTTEQQYKINNFLINNDPFFKKIREPKQP